MRRASDRFDKMLTANLNSWLRKGGLEMIKFEAGEASRFVGRVAMVRRRKAFDAFAFTVVASTLALGAHSQETAANSTAANTSGGSDLAEIVVTARRVEEKLQDVPISITAYSQEQLEARNIVNSAGIYNDGNWHQVVDVYQPASSPNVTGTNILYVDGVVDTIVTEMAYMRVTPEGLRLEEVAPGLTVDDVQQATEANLYISPALKTM